MKLEQNKKRLKKLFYGKILTLLTFSLSQVKPKAYLDTGQKIQVNFVIYEREYFFSQ